MAIGEFDPLAFETLIFCHRRRHAEALMRAVQNSNTGFSVPLNHTSESEYLEDLSFNTVYFHESRHFHDYLVTPLLGYALQLRLLMALHAIQALACYRHVGYNLLPLPLTNWFALSRDQQNNYLQASSTSDFIARAPLVSEKKNTDYRDFVESRHSERTISDVDRLLQWATAYYLEYTEVDRPRYDNYGREYSARTIMESDAVIQQVVAADCLYGRTAKNSFWEFLQRRHASELSAKTSYSVYTDIISLIGAYLKDCPKIGPEKILEFAPMLLFWTLSPDLLNPSANCSAAERLFGFIDQNVAYGMSVEDILRNPIDTFREWNRRLGDSTLDFQLFYGFQSKSRHDIYRNFSELRVGVFDDYSRMQCDAFDQITRQFLLNPGLYISPYGYMSSYHRFVNVPIRFITKSQIVNVPELPRDYDDIKDFMYFTTMENPFVSVEPSQLPKCSESLIFNTYVGTAFKHIFMLFESLFKDEPNPESIKMLDQEFGIRTISIF